MRVIGFKDNKLSEITNRTLKKENTCLDSQQRKPKKERYLKIMKIFKLNWIQFRIMMHSYFLKKIYFPKLMIKLKQILLIDYLSYKIVATIKRSKDQALILYVSLCTTIERKSKNVFLMTITWLSSGCTIDVMENFNLQKQEIKRKSWLKYSKSLMILHSTH